MRTFNDFLAILTELIQFLKEAAMLEQEKMEAAKKHRVTILEECMKKEQVIILKLKGYDKTREEIQADLGFSGLSFQEILAACTAEQNIQLTPLFQQLSEQVKIFNDTTDCAKNIIEINLHKVNSLIAQGQDDTVGYSVNGTPQNSNRNLTNIKI